MERPEQVLTQTDLPIGKKFSGKVRDNYLLDGHLLMITTDRISALDCVLPEGVPHKGRVLTQLSHFWFDRTSGMVPNHLVTCDPKQIVETVPALRDHGKLLDARAMLVRRADPVPVECVVRGYLYGSAYRDYQADGTVCGISLPTGLPLGARLEHPLFTPARKVQNGHDVNMTFEEMAEEMDEGLASRLRDLSVQLYLAGRQYLDERGLILVDTKFEFGHLPDGTLIVIDELLTPDSSRIWRREDYRVAERIESYDKQPLRDYLEHLVQAGKWDRRPPAPPLPERLREILSARYVEVYELITGESLGC